MRLILASAILFWTISAFSSELPDALKGKWRIAEVHINSESPRTPFYAWNDPRLVGRFFNFTRNRITNDTLDDSECVFPNLKVSPVRLSELISKSMAGYGYPPRSATAHDYRLNAGQDKNSEVIQVFCNEGLWNGDLGLDDGVRGSWIFISSTDQILLRWRDETILVLTRLSGNETNHPSIRPADSERKK
jgi:hypothetical protein